jgi:hypothetical protein
MAAPRLIRLVAQSRAKMRRQKRCNEGGAEALGDQRVHNNGTKPTILMREALTALRSGSRRRLTTVGIGPDRRLRAGCQVPRDPSCVHNQRGWDALIAIEALMSLRWSMGEKPGRLQFVWISISTSPHPRLRATIQSPAVTLPWLPLRSIVGLRDCERLDFLADDPLKRFAYYVGRRRSAMIKDVAAAPSAPGRPSAAAEAQSRSC